MAAPSPIRSALNRRLGVDDPDAPDTQTPPPPEITLEKQRNPFGDNIGYGPIQAKGTAPNPTLSGGRNLSIMEPSEPNPSLSFAPGEPTPGAGVPQTQPMPELGDWRSVQSGDWSRAWSDFIEKKYGTAARGGGFANMPGGGVQQAVSDFNRATGANARMVPSASGDMIDFGDGRGPVDVKTAEGLLWNQRLGGNNGIGGGGAAGAGGGAGMGAFGAGGGMTSSVSPFSQQVRDQIMAQLTQLGKPVDENDPSIAPEMQAQTRLAERARQDRRAAAAERASADGLLNGGQGSGSFESEVASGYEDKGQQLQGIQAQLFGREIQSRRDKVAQLLNDRDAVR
jgi:hypothetical protein